QSQVHFTAERGGLHSAAGGSVVTALCHTALHFEKCILALHAHSHSSRSQQPCFSHPECPLVQSAPPPTHTHTHTQVLHLSMGPSYSVTATPPMTPREAIPPLTSFVANREHRSSQE